MFFRKQVETDIIGATSMPDSEPEQVCNGKKPMTKEIAALLGYEPGWVRRKPTTK